MKYLLILIIKTYWIIIPKNKRRKCIFNKSCSNYVYDETIAHGLIIGLKELNFRIKNCQPVFDIFRDDTTGKRKMILRTGIIVDEHEIAERLK
ncbi:membrane protein insertion efficiency factor YidD [Maribacter spongiicola]|uniref:membrane protein insertion efficiency factor YidD n=1 Tax=Maribacter spongiicola TaxID=1206753 RepID=UPI003F94CC4E